MNNQWRDQLAQTGIANLGQILQNEELTAWRDTFDADRKQFPYFWRHYGHHQNANYDALITTPQFDELIRHPRILPVIEDLMGGPVCFGEIGLRYMPPTTASSTAAGIATNPTGPTTRCVWTTFS